MHRRVWVGDPPEGLLARDPDVSTVVVRIPKGVLRADLAAAFPDSTRGVRAQLDVDLPRQTVRVDGRLIRSTRALEAATPPHKWWWWGAPRRWDPRLFTQAGFVLPYEMLAHCAAPLVAAHSGRYTICADGSRFCAGTLFRLVRPTDGAELGRVRATMMFDDATGDATGDATVVLERCD